MLKWDSMMCMCYKAVLYVCFPVSFRNFCYYELALATPSPHRLRQVVVGAVPNDKR